MTRTSRDAFAFLAGVFLLCMSVLMIQIIQTRILSVVSLYYMAFFSISMAMLGLTGGALIVYYKLDHVNSGERQRLPVEDIDGFRVVHRRLLHPGARVSPAEPGLGDLRRALAQGHRAARGAVHGRRHCGVARPDAQRLPDRHHLWRRPARRRDRLPRLAGPADVDGRLVGHVHDSGPGRGRRLVLWPCRLRARSGRPRPELAHFREAGLRRRLPGGACRHECPTDAGLQPIVVKFDRLDPLSSISHIKWNSFSRIVCVAPRWPCRRFSGAPRRRRRAASRSSSAN